MKQKFIEFMRGRYGTDELNQLMSIVSLVFIIPAFITKQSLFVVLGYMLIGFTLFRMLSKDIPARARERAAFLQLKNKILRKNNATKQKLEQRKDYKFYRCPNCKKELRVPKKKGKVRITCPHCKTNFERKT